jgi:hypothetical protein
MCFSKASAWGDIRGDSVERICGEEEWIGYVDRICGQDAWIGYVDRMRGEDMWIGCVDRICGQDAWIGWRLVEICHGGGYEDSLLRLVDN